MIKKQQIICLTTLSPLLLLPNMFYSQQTYVNVGPRSWIYVNILFFDGFTATITTTINSMGNYCNATIFVKGKTLNSSDMVVSMQEMIHEVTFSSDRNMTIFIHTARYVPSNRPNILGGLPIFPFDEYKFNLQILTNLNMTMDNSEKMALLPTVYYESFYHITIEPDVNALYRINIDLIIKHPPHFITQIAIIMWGTFFLLLCITIYLFIRYKRKSTNYYDVIIIASPLLMNVILNVETLINNFTAPLGLTLIDIGLYILFIFHGILFVFTLALIRAPSTILSKIYNKLFKS